MNYPTETLHERMDDGTMPENVATLAGAVVGRRIVSAEKGRTAYPDRSSTGMLITLDDGSTVVVSETEDCCAGTWLDGFWLDPSSVDHIITGVGTTDTYTVWHIYADMGDIMRLNVDWSCGNPFYYGYGFAITVMKP